jgi:uncharacterized protein YkwD
LSGQRGRRPDNTADIHATDPWAHTAPLDVDAYQYPEPYPGYPEPYDEDPNVPPGRGRRMRPLAVLGTICAIVISIGLVVVLLAQGFAGKPTSTGAPNLPGLLEQPPAATLPPQAAPEVPVPSDTPSASPEPTLSAQPTPTRAAAGNAAVEDAVVALVNGLRRKARCDAVQNDPRLRQAARQHSADMAAGGFLSHTGSDGSSAADRMRGAGYDAPLSENLARGFGSARDVVQGWLDSREQRQNILNCDAQAIGVGVVVGADGRPYWTQDFGR